MTLNETLVIREYEVIDPLPARKGVIGEMWCKEAQKTYLGGDIQYEFWYSGSDLTPTWQKYLKKTGVEVKLN